MVARLRAGLCGLQLTAVAGALFSLAKTVEADEQEVEQEAHASHGFDKYCAFLKTLELSSTATATSATERGCVATRGRRYRAADALALTGTVRVTGLFIYCPSMGIVLDDSFRSAPRAITRYR